MKLKYYMRGLGVGIVIATLILSLQSKKKELSDQEIINRALQLGMVMKEDTKGNLDDVYEKLGEVDNSVTKDEKDTEESKDPSDEIQEDDQANDENSNDSNTNDEETNLEHNNEEPVDDTDQASKGENSEISGDEDIADATQDTSSDPVSNQTSENTSDSFSENSSSKLIEFTIKQGMTTEAVSKLLHKVGLITDSSDFTKYVKSMGKTTSIRKGSFAISSNASYEEILSIITKTGDD